MINKDNGLELLPSKRSSAHALDIPKSNRLCVDRLAAVKYYLMLITLGWMNTRYISNEVLFHI